MRLAHAARLLADARTLDALRPLARALGFPSAPLPLPRSVRDALALDGCGVTRARLVVGAPPLHLLLAELRDATTPRDAARLLATRLAAHAPHARWLLLLVHPTTPALALAAPAPRTGAAPPRLAALVCDPAHVRDSDAETLRALAAHAPPPDAPPDAALLAHQRWLDILGRERLGARFYHALARVVDDLAHAAAPTVPDAAARRDLALLHTTRLLFLAFLEAKGWLDGDPAFLARHYDACLRTGGRFDARVLRPLFFGTLNTPRRARAPAARAFGRVPFLNGGLFAPTPLERRWRALRFDDAALGALVHDLLGHYRFTAREDAGDWSEAAVDPEMLGRAFESLMAGDERRRTGSFYTPQALVARVTDAALREALRRPPEASGPSIPDALVDAALAGEDVTRDAHAPALLARVAALRLLDPSCGSGAFLVHALERVADLRAGCGDARPVAERRRETLTRSIFGVDRSATAIWLCELRLWLSVVIELDVVSAPVIRGTGCKQFRNTEVDRRRQHHGSGPQTGRGGGESSAISRAPRPNVQRPWSEEPPLGEAPQNACLLTEAVVRRLQKAEGSALGDTSARGGSRDGERSVVPVLAGRARSIRPAPARSRRTSGQTLLGSGAARACAGAPSRPRQSSGDLGPVPAASPSVTEMATSGRPSFGSRVAEGSEEHLWSRKS